MKIIPSAALALALAFSLTASRAQEPGHPIVKAVASKLTNPEKMFTLIVRANVKEGEAEKFIAAFADAVGPTRAEQGCTRYELNQINGEANAFVVYERWRNLDALKAHLDAPHTVKLLEAILPLVDGDPDFIVLTPKADPANSKTESEKPAADPGKTSEQSVKELEEAAEKAKAQLKKTIEELEKELKKENAPK